MISRWLSTVSLTVVLTSLASAVAGEVPPPANAAAKFRWNAGRSELTVEYHGGTILTASVAAKDAAGKDVPDTAADEKGAAGKPDAS